MRDGRTLGYSHGYPQNGTMRSFVHGLENTLGENPKIDFLLNHRVGGVNKPKENIIITSGNNFEIQSRHVFWSGPVGQMLGILDQGIKSPSRAHTLDLLTYVYEVPGQESWHAGTYAVIYDPNILLFRASAAGKYSGQVTDKGTTFVPRQKCCLQLVNKRLPAEVVWRDLCESNLMEDNTIALGHAIGRLPRAYTLPFAHAQPLKSVVDMSAYSHIHHYPQTLIGRAAKLDWANDWVTAQ